MSIFSNQMVKRMDITKPYSLITLLPHSENSELINKKQKLDYLYFVTSIVEMGLLALEGFINENLSLFDAQVGENLCQIRAYKTLDLANKYFSCPSSKNNLIKETHMFKILKNQLADIIVQWEDFLSHVSLYDKNLDAHEPIELFINRQHLQLNLSEDVVYIIICFFLTHFSIRNEGIPSSINLNFISRELHISKYRAKRLAHRYQVILCKLGCEYIIKAAEHMPNERGYSTIMPYLRQLSDENRMVVPCYITSEVIFSHIIREKTPVLFIINRIYYDDKNSNDCIYFILIGKENEFNLIQMSSEDYVSPYCMVVFGDAHFEHNCNDLKQNHIDFILAETPLKLILANTASHPQYSGKLLAKYQENPYLHLTIEKKFNNKNYHEDNLMNMQRFAVENGCTKKNPSTFLLKHIYASRTMVEINKLNAMHANKICNKKLG